jgi:hypothetical protein
VVSETAAEIARLEARVSALETALGKRSRLLRALTRELCDDDLASFSRLAAGLPPLPRAGIGIVGWRETTALTSGDVERTMSDLWRSLAAVLPEEE